ncbi:hypothetical protein KL944_001292 [Ogataea haglerorum]|nr:hypothetical protein KL944_001292 [Ogataea haglerorum]
MEWCREASAGREHAHCTDDGAEGVDVVEAKADSVDDSAAVGSRGCVYFAVAIVEAGFENYLGIEDLGLRYYVGVQLSGPPQQSLFVGVARKRIGVIVLVGPREDHDMGILDKWGQSGVLVLRRFVYICRAELLRTVQ